MQSSQYRPRPRESEHGYIVIWWVSRNTQCLRRIRSENRKVQGYRVPGLKAAWSVIRGGPEDPHVPRPGRFSAVYLLRGA